MDTQAQNPKPKTAPSDGARLTRDNWLDEAFQAVVLGGFENVKVLAIAEKEGGKPGQWVKNMNGTYDVGPMQFNTHYLSDLARYGITAAHVAAAGCYSYDLAAWRLRGHLLNDKGDIWTRAANYHSRTPKYNSIYRADLMHKAGRWAVWLDKHFITKEVSFGAKNKGRGQ